MSSLRTEETEKKFQELKQQGGMDNGCGLCNQQALKMFKYWKITENQHPYDRIAKVHHILIPLRHTTEYELNEDEIKELRKIKDDIVDKEYEYIIEATLKKKAIPGHYHLHLIVSK
jgi:hypothetical protein